MAKPFKTMYKQGGWRCTISTFDTYEEAKAHYDWLLKERATQHSAYYLVEEVVRETNEKPKAKGGKR